MRDIKLNNSSCVPSYSTVHGVILKVTHFFYRWLFNFFSLVSLFLFQVPCYGSMVKVYCVRLQTIRYSAIQPQILYQHQIWSEVLSKSIRMWTHAAAHKSIWQTEIFWKLGSVLKIKKIGFGKSTTLYVGACDFLTI